MPPALCAVLLAVLLTVSACVTGEAQPVAAPPEAPPAAAAEPAVPPEDAASRRLTAPRGFQVRIFADRLPGRARMLTFSPAGQLYVTLTGDGQVVRVPDSDHDGLADEVQVVAQGLRQPHGLEWHDGWLYVAENDKVTRLRDADGDGSLELKELVTDNLPGGGGHHTRTLHFGPDGQLYVSAGSSCNVCNETDPRRATIMRFTAGGGIPADNPWATDPDPRRQAVWAVGLRNAVDFVFTPDGSLWANHNGSDGLGDDAPPEEIVIPVQRGGHHGWPFYYTPVLGANLPPHQKPEVRDERLPLPPQGLPAEQVVPALFTDAAHEAPLGMAWGSGDNFPAEYRDDLYVAYHGSWNTSRASYRDAKVQRIVIEHGLPVRAEEFLNGWRAEGQPAGSRASFGRPVDVAFGPDGAMYVSDDHTPRIYRVVWRP